jgi:hypothetical protein
VTACSATTTVPCRADPAFAPTVNSTDPLPLPDARVTAIHESTARAVQSHPAMAETWTRAVPPAAGISSRLPST